MVLILLTQKVYCTLYTLVIMTLIKNISCISYKQVLHILINIYIYIYIKYRTKCRLIVVIVIFMSAKLIVFISIVAIFTFTEIRCAVQQFLANEKNAQNAENGYN